MPGGFGSTDMPPTPVSIFQIPLDPLDGDGWVEAPLGTFRVPMHSLPVDIDGDGDLDIIAGARGSGTLTIFESGGGPSPGFDAVELQIAGRRVPRGEGAKRLDGMHLALADLSGDGRLDIATFETPFSIVWVEQPADLRAPWLLHPIASLLPDSPTALTLVDIDGDGRLDLISGGYSKDPRHRDALLRGPFHRAGGLWWFHQPGDSTQPWPRHDVSRRVRGMYDALWPVDLNDDGLVDFIGTRGNSGAYDGVFWLEQRRSDQPIQALTPAREAESAQLPAPPRWLTWFGERALLR